MASRNPTSLAQISILQSKNPKPYKLQDQKPFELLLVIVENITPTTSWTTYIKYCIKYSFELHGYGRDETEICFAFDLTLILTRGLTMYMQIL